MTNKLAEALAHASETDKIELAHIFANTLDTGKCARMCVSVAAFDYFAAPRKGERF